MTVIVVTGKQQLFRKDVAGALRCLSSVEQALRVCGYATGALFIRPSDFRDRAALEAKIRHLRPGCVFNLFEGFSQESQKEIEFVRILEEMVVPFTGNASSTLKICLDKARMKEVLTSNGIPVPQGFFVTPHGKAVFKKPSFPLFVKPCFEDGSVGIDATSLVTTEEELERVLKLKLKEFPCGLIVEEFIAGKEYSVGLLGKAPYETLNVSVVDYSSNTTSPYLCYNSKWNELSEEYKATVPHIGSVDDEMQRRVIEQARRAGMALGCASYFRVDLREQNGQLAVLDVNPNPDINTDSGFLKQAYSKGYTYEEVIEHIVKYAL